MTQEEKQLLLKDFCARLPYRIQLHHYQGADCTLKYFDPITFAAYVEVKNFEYFKEFLEDGQRSLFEYKSYLRPMSSMTEEEAKDYFKNSEYESSECYEASANYELVTVKAACSADESCVNIDWLNAHYFDYRGLIPMGLAYEAPEGMYTVLCRNIGTETDFREETPFFDKNGVRIYDGDVFVYLKYTNFENGVPSDLIENYSKYANEVELHPVFWHDKEKSWCSDVYGDCDYMASYNFDYVVVVTNRNEHPELYNY